MIINRQVKQDIAIIRESQIRMEEDVKYHIKRTDSLEAMVKPIYKVYITVKYALLFAAFSASLVYGILRISDSRSSTEVPEIKAVLPLLTLISECDIIVTSCHRTHQHNAEVGGSNESRHVLGTAVDITSSNCSLDYLQDRSNDLFLRSYKYDNHLHLDLRYPIFNQ